MLWWGEAEEAGALGGLHPFIEVRAQFLARDASRLLNRNQMIARNALPLEDGGVGDVAGSGQFGQAPTFCFDPCGEFFHDKFTLVWLTAKGKHFLLGWLHGRVFLPIRSC